MTATDAENDADYLLGVIVEHAPRQGASSLAILPLDRLLEDREKLPHADAWWARLGVSDPECLPMLPAPRHRPHAAAASGRLGFEPETVLIEAGAFWMGADDGGEFERPRQRVVLGAYEIGRYPVTHAQFAEFVRRTGLAIAPEMGWRLARLGQEPPEEKLDHPAAGMTWDEAVAYCRWLSEQTGRPYRLPNEAEWEKAARGADGRRYPWGDSADAERCNVLESGNGMTTAVRVYSPIGHSIYGCADMVGNVWEWTSTIWGIEHAHPQFGPPYRADDGREAFRTIDAVSGATRAQGRLVPRSRRARDVLQTRSRGSKSSGSARHGSRVVLAESRLPGGT